MPNRAKNVRHRHGLEALVHRLKPEGAGGSLTLTVAAPLTQLNLRGDASNESFVAAVGQTLGQSLPLAANTFSSGAHDVYWLGPDEWLVCSESEVAGRLIGRLQDALSGQSAAVTNVSAGQVALQLRGEAARHILAKGCTLNLEPSAFRVGDCAQSGLAKATALVALRDESPRFDIFVRRSFAEYVVLWLHHAGREYGLKVREATVD